MHDVSRDKLKKLRLLSAVGYSLFTKWSILIVQYQLEIIQNEL